ncbi:MAG: OmpA family protein [Burkholderiales bacterium]|nr:OmpA family protein [Burkholderiales bacterium]
MMHLKLITLALGALFGTAHAQAPADAPARGKVLANDRTFVHGTPPSSEAPSDLSAPSGRAASDVVRTRAAARADARKPSPCGTGSATRPGVPFRVSVDGIPLEEDQLRPEADRSRCVDVALERADIQLKYDPLNVSPALNAWTTKASVLRGAPIELHTYSNYMRWIARSEIRVFQKGQDVATTPLAVLPVTIGASTTWRPDVGSAVDLVYVLRAYDERGRFDETGPKRLALIERETGFDDQDRLERERLAGYGENSRQLANIPVRGGTVTVSGSAIRADQTVSVFGGVIPVDPKGKFATRQILPAGPHSIEVTVSEKDGSAASFRRNLSIAEGDWFYVALADITLGRNHTSGPAQLVTQDSDHYDNKVYLDGRGAFYLRGLIKGEYLLTAAADTREQPLRDLFSNFSSKDPRYLLRRIDPDRYYPVYGDDSTLADDAPTQGKFYVRLQKDESHVMWGNFQTSWTGTELTQYSRGLYGANIVWRPSGSTSYGEKRTAVNAFAAEPGTLQSREEFRGTGGSLYYLRHQDITLGSERVWVEIRDKDSGLVLTRTPLRPAEDFEVNYLQGRLILRAPLPSTADGSELVQTSTLNGHPVYLVTTYEYVPGVTALDSNAYGLRAHQWLNDHVGIGVAAYKQGDPGSDQRLRGIDLTLRYKPGSYIKAEAAHSRGPGSDSASSLDGGFAFNAQARGGQGADARRIEAGIELSDVSDTLQGRVRAYWQDKDAGYTGPGQITWNGEATEQRGASGVIELSPATALQFKADERLATSQDLRVLEAGVRHRLSPQWSVGAGVRYDERDTRIANASPTLSQSGERTDIVLRLDYRPLLAPAEAARLDELAKQQGETAKAGGNALPATAPQPAPGTASSAMLPTVNATLHDAPALAPGSQFAPEPGMRYEPWSLYGFVQGTASHSGNRTPNDRAGVGGSWQLTDRLRLIGEASSGDGGLGGKVGGDWRIDDRSNAYLNYTMETERPDAAYRGRFANLVSGTRHRLSERLATFGESRWGNGAGPESLTHAFGIDYAPADRWTTGFKFETGKLTDPLAGDMKRRAAGVSAAYRHEQTRLASALEYRADDASATGERRTWLMRNSLGHQATPAWRLLGKLNFSFSDASAGRFYDGDFVEVVTGAAHRPVENNRWNTLFKYTYFYTLPSPGQVGANNTLLDFAQRSHVLNVDTMYDVKPWLTLGFKYGLRVGELKDAKVGGDWYSSRADLVIGRIDYHWVKEWDAVVELRRLAVREAQDSRKGALIAVYRHVGEGVKLGVGYNFTDFSDNLTDLSYRSRGVFLNVLAAF